jgi:8-oxo-dGTP pyrophosphatase MutT (NUDIX family)
MTLPLETSPWSPTLPPHLERAVGAVVVDPDHALVLVREVAGGFGGCAWTPLAKGRPDLGESDEACALREVHEEMGAGCVIVGELPGWWIGSTTATRLFIARVVGALVPHDAETASVRWVALDEARELVALSPSPVVQRRDLAVLDSLRAVSPPGVGER